MPGVFEAIVKLPPAASQQQVQHILSSELDVLLVEPKLATTLFSQLSKCGKLQLALHVFRTLQLARAETNIFHYGSLLSASELHWSPLCVRRDLLDGA
eukprot:Skav232955  [mRNA]  locus=scaffold1860:182857:183400:+ [translate_table: standard]